MQDLLDDEFLISICKGLHHNIEFETYTGKAKMIKEGNLHPAIFQIITRGKLGQKNVDVEVPYPKIKGRYCDIVIKDGGDILAWFELKYCKSGSRIEKEIRKEIIRLINGIDKGRRFLLILSSTDKSDNDLLKGNKEGRLPWIYRKVLDWKPLLSTKQLSQYNSPKDKAEFTRQNPAGKFVDHKFSELVGYEKKKIATMITRKGKKSILKGKPSLDEYRSRIVYSRRRSNTTLICWEISTLETKGINPTFPY